MYIFTVFHNYKVTMFFLIMQVIHVRLSSVIDFEKLNKK
jgi:hypothetical protein